MRKSLVLITQGDTNGIGLEILLKSFEKNPEKFKNCVLISNKNTVLEYAKKLKYDAEFEFKKSFDFSGKSETLKVLDVLDYCEVRFSECDKKSGLISFNSVKKALDIIKNEKEFNFSLVTLPISKEAWFKAGIRYPGHTDFLAEYFEIDEYTMILYSPKFSVALVTVHIPISKIPEHITFSNVFRTLKHSYEIGKKLYPENLKIAVSALNPHAGENGYLGDEEKIIRKALDSFPYIKDKTVYPPDTLFYKVNKGEFNMVVCMYHDQGLIPFKAINFDDGVNLTAGLPFMRTSPDHGVAFDIAGKNKAKPDSFLKSLEISKKFL